MWEWWEVQEQISNSYCIDYNYSGWCGYIISGVNSINKYSGNYKNCTWVVAIGESIESWENISILTHQNPVDFVPESENDCVAMRFERILRSTLEELKTRSKPWSVDILILGGNDLQYKSEYISSIETLDSIVMGVFWFHPVVVWWPVNVHDSHYYGRDIFIDTMRRRVILCPRTPAEIWWTLQQVVHTVNCSAKNVIHALYPVR